LRACKALTVCYQHHVLTHRPIIVRLPVCAVSCIAQHLINTFFISCLTAATLSPAWRLPHARHAAPDAATPAQHPHRLGGAAGAASTPPMHTYTLLYGRHTCGGVCRPSSFVSTAPCICGPYASEPYDGDHLRALSARTDYSKRCAGMDLLYDTQTTPVWSGNAVRRSSMMSGAVRR
jgi:hypothetical protein